MTEHGCKVCRVLAERGMGRYEDQLVDQWQAEGPERKGYRQLAEWLNVTMLRREMDRAGLSTLGQEAESKYERLRSDDESVADEVAAGLSGAGIDVERLRRDFVSYAVVRTHLKECLGLEYTPESGDWETKTIEMAGEYASQKVSEAVRSLSNKGELEGGELTVDVSVTIECETCHAAVPVERAVRRGYICDCE
ncbi:rod-determining factor RdfA [Haloglomus litoreum]|uniref:rod-determining factor RdfA n=1 Tax=Haloglomus litoreum TaxID=3034026 RepID=UPI0023E82C03|nr:rod-determining factor RdfA [Haloglomus sp. DT116]